MGAFGGSLVSLSPAPARARPRLASRARARVPGRGSPLLYRLVLAQLSAMNAEKLKKMAESVRTGGKGSVRRKKKAIHKTTTTDDKRLQNTLKRLGVNNIPAIEEVNLFKDNGTVIHFTNPKVQASIAANTYVISGHAETKKLQDLLPGIINQLGPDNLAALKKVAQDRGPTMAGAGGQIPEGDEEEDDEMPSLTNFESANK
jgi:nascent polypeptide-associated complex subunit beta